MMQAACALIRPRSAAQARLHDRRLRLRLRRLHRERAVDEFQHRQGALRQRPGRLPTYKTVRAYKAQVITLMQPAVEQKLIESYSRDSPL